MYVCVCVCVNIYRERNKKNRSIHLLVFFIILK